MIMLTLGTQPTIANRYFVRKKGRIVRATDRSEDGSDGSSTAAAINWDPLQGVGSRLMIGSCSLASQSMHDVIATRQFAVDVANAMATDCYQGRLSESGGDGRRDESPRKRCRRWTFRWRLDVRLDVSSWILTKLREQGV